MIDNLISKKKLGNTVSLELVLDITIIKSFGLRIKRLPVLQVIERHVVAALEPLKQSNGKMRPITLLKSEKGDMHNKLFKSDSARVAFLLCVGFSG